MSEIKVCSAALRLMCQILNWNFKQAASVSGPSSCKTHAFSSGIRHDTLLLKKFERSLVEVHLSRSFYYLVWLSCNVLLFLLLLVARACMAWCSYIKWTHYLASELIWGSSPKVFIWSFVVDWVSSCRFCSAAYSSTLLLVRVYISRW